MKRQILTIEALINEIPFENKLDTTLNNLNEDVIQELLQTGDKFKHLVNHIKNLETKCLNLQRESEIIGGLTASSASYYCSQIYEEPPQPYVVTTTNNTGDVTLTQMVEDIVDECNFGGVK